MADFENIVRVTAVGLDETATGLGKLESAITNLRKENQGLRKEQTDAYKGMKAGNEEAAKQYGLVSQKIAQNTAEIKKLGKENTVALKTYEGAKSAAGSIQALTAKIAALRAEAQGLSPASARFQQISKEIKASDVQLNNLNHKLSGSKTFVGEYAAGIKQAFTSLAGGLGIGFAIQQVISFGKASLEAYSEHEQSEARLQAAIRSTGGAAQMTKEDLDKLSESLEKATTYSKAEITAGEALLLTFTSIGKDVFPQAQEAILNMANAMNYDLKDVTIEVGKALNDPIAGLNALHRVGVAFTAQQKEQIKAMVQVGNVAGAQGVILKELNTEFGGVAKAAANTSSGGIKQFQNSLEDVKEDIGKKIIPAVASLAQYLRDFLDNLKPIKDVLRPINDSINQMGEYLGKLAQYFGSANDKMSAGAKTAKFFSYSMYIGLTPLRLILQGLGWLSEKLAGFAPTLVGFGRAVAATFTGIKDIAIKTFSGVGSVIKDTFTLHWSDLSKDSASLKAGFHDFGASIAKAYTDGYNETLAKGLDKPTPDGGTEPGSKKPKTKPGLTDAQKKKLQDEREAAQQAFEQKKQDQQQNEADLELMRMDADQKEVEELNRKYDTIKAKAHGNAEQLKEIQAQYLNDYNALIKKQQDKTDAEHQAEIAKEQAEKSKHLSDELQDITDKFNAKQALLKAQYEKGEITKMQFDQQAGQLEINMLKEQKAAIDAVLHPKTASTSGIAALIEISPDEQKKIEKQLSDLSTKIIKTASDTSKAVQNDNNAISESYMRMGSSALNSVGAIASALKASASIQKTIAYGETIISTFQAATLADLNARKEGLPDPLPEIAAGVAIAQGIARAVQISQQKFAEGGVVNGPSHAGGGVNYWSPYSNVQLEGGEAVMSKGATSMFLPVLGAMNAAGGGVNFARGGGIPSFTAPINLPATVSSQAENSAKVLHAAVTDAMNGAITKINNIQHVTPVQKTDKIYTGRDWAYQRAGTVN